MAAADTESFFAFTKLPDLIQYIILSHTDLIPQGSVPIRIASRSRVDPNDRSVGPRKSTAPSDHSILCTCQLCAAQILTSLRVVPSCLTCARVAGTPMTVTLGWVFPLSVFLVSRQINLLAKSVFFSQNTFVMWEDSMPPRGGLAREASSEFVYLDLAQRKLRQIPLASFRWLELRLETFRAFENKRDGICYELWRKLAETMRTTIITGRLTLVIDFSYLNNEYVGTAEGPEDKWMAYQSIAGAFTHKETLFKDFFLHLSSPELVRYENDIIRWNRERTLEKLVMNDQNYDAASRGKYKDRWLDESTGPRMYFRNLLRRVDLDPLDDRDPEVRASILDGTLMDRYKDFDYSKYFHFCAGYEQCE